MFQLFDGSGRPPRPAQNDVLRWLSQNWARSSIMAFQAPPGVGKTAIAMAIQNEFGGHVVTISNQLLDQYAESYADTPVLRGRQHYECTTHEDLSCGDVKALGRKLCSDCPYRKARKGCREGFPTLANPASYFYASMVPGFQEPDVLVIDEAHRLYDMAMMFVDTVLSVSDYAIPKSLKTLVDFTDWVPLAVGVLREEGMRFLKAGALEKGAQKARQASRLAELKLAVEAEPENFWLYREERPWRNVQREYLCIRPLTAPAKILNQLLGAKKVVLMSATLFRADVERLFPGRPYQFLDLPSPIPKAQRAIYSCPVAPKVNKDTDPMLVAEWIRGWRRRWPDRNTIVHVSYSWAERLRPFFAPGEALFNTKEDKAHAIATFKAVGGLFLAAGCAEGIDLPGDQCRLNLIPILHRENLGDPAVQKRRSLPGGQRAFDLEILKTTIQQAGRSSRGPDDWSLTIVGDPVLPLLVNMHRADLPRSFVEALQFGRRP